MVFRFVFVLWFVLSAPLFVFAQSSVDTGALRSDRFEQNNVMILWERIVSGQKKPEFRSHLMFNVPPNEARSFFQNISPSAKQYGAADIAHESSPLCLSQDQEPELTIVDTRGMELADKLSTLRGLNGIYVDFRAVRGPRTFSGDFGRRVHEYVIAALQKSGIPLLGKKELEITPGKPTLSFRYSAEVDGCRPWSVSLSLKQTTVLTRDTRIMLSASTWSASARQSEEDIDYNVLDALRDAVEKFVTDYAKANSVTAKELRSQTTAKK